MIPEAREFSMVAFPAGAEGGNPAGVVLDPGDPTSAQMTATAIRLNPLSETAFVWPEPGAAAGDPARFRLRYFAPAGEVALCGHATAAAFGALALAGRCAGGAVEAVAPGGRIRGRVAAEGGAAGVRIELDMPVARRAGPPPGRHAVAAALGAPEACLAPGSLPLAVEDVGIPILLVPLAGEGELVRLCPDPTALRALAGDLIVIYAFAVLATPEGLRIRARSFAPAVAIDEDPATGTAAAALGAYLAREGLLGGGRAPVAVRILQGVEMGRPSALDVTVRHAPGEIVGVRVGGMVRAAAAR
jgi:PhzF family phenazine biosynthesis protein